MKIYLMYFSLIKVKIKNVTKQIIVKKDTINNGKLTVCYILDLRIEVQINYDYKNCSRLNQNEKSNDLDVASPLLEKKIKKEEESNAGKNLRDETQNMIIQDSLEKSNSRVSKSNSQEDSQKNYNPFTSSISNSVGLSLPSSLQNPSPFSSIEEPKFSYISETPKFPNEQPLPSTLAGINKIIPKINEKIIPKYQREKHIEKSKKYPDFETSFTPISPEKNDKLSLVPGLDSNLLRDALGMRSDLDPPPYFKKLLIVGIPTYYHTEVFYGINTKIPKQYNIKSWKEAGIDPYMIEGENMEINIIPDDSKYMGKSNSSKADLTEDQYLERYIRKPVIIDIDDPGIKRSMHDTIEID